MKGLTKRHRVSWGQTMVIAQVELVSVVDLQPNENDRNTHLFFNLLAHFEVSLDYYSFTKCIECELLACDAKECILKTLFFMPTPRRRLSLKIISSIIFLA